jgi:hypothetical protein
MGLPSIVHSPSSGWDKPARISSNVVFPHPLGPSMTRNSPLLMDKFTPPNAWKVSVSEFPFFFLLRISNFLQILMASISVIVPIHLHMIIEKFR